MISTLLIQGVPIECINKAAVTYFVPAKVIISVLKSEGGLPGLAKPNKNKTVDYGPMQINSIWLKHIAPYGYTQREIQYDPCINVMVGTWILSQEIAQGKTYWEGVGGYHSHTLYFKQIYQNHVLLNYRYLEEELKAS